VTIGRGGRGGVACMPEQYVYSRVLNPRRRIGGLGIVATPEAKAGSGDFGVELTPYANVGRGGRGITLTPDARIGRGGRGAIEAPEANRRQFNCPLSDRL